jgi:NTP pyrophosphatase (non-canonical NTP hydrolase)
MGLGGMMEIGEFQKEIERIYLARDKKRGMEGTFMWFVEEVGELSTGLRGDDKLALQREFADALAWLVTLASLAGISMEEAVKKYADGCPRCHRTPCTCSEKR